MFYWSSIPKRDGTLDASDQRDLCGCTSPHHFHIFIFLRFHLLLVIYLCNTNCLETGQDQRIHKALFSYFSMKMFAVGYSLEAALSNVNGNFTLIKLMKRPKTFCDPARDEYPQLTLFRDIYSKHFNNV